MLKDLAKQWISKLVHGWCSTMTALKINTAEVMSNQAKEIVTRSKIILYFCVHSFPNNFFYAIFLFTYLVFMLPYFHLFCYYKKLQYFTIKIWLPVNTYIYIYKQYIFIYTDKYIFSCFLEIQTNNQHLNQINII